MSIINNGLLLASQAAAAGGYTIERSLRFSSPDSAYLSRTPASAGNRKTWTWSGWVKRGGLGVSNKPFFVAGTTNANRLLVYFNNVDKIQVFRNSGGSSESITGTANYRDPSAWYHIVVSWNASSSVASVYVNGVVASGLDAAAVSNVDSPVNSTDPQYLGGQAFDSVAYFDGYLADVYLIDGSALDPTSFGEFDTNGVWQPIAYAGSYGTNGFHLDFADNSSAAALGYDAAGSNDWTVNNLSVTAGAGNDSLRDSPTNGDTADDTGLGGELAGNYCTLNPLDTGTNTSLTNGNLQFANTVSEWSSCLGTVFVSSGKWYAEAVVSEASGNGYGWGIAKTGQDVNIYLGVDAKGWALFANGANAYTFHNGSYVTGSYTSLSNGDILGMALDMDAGTLTYYVNNVSKGVAFTGITGEVTFAVTAYNVNSPTIFNFGQRPFAYSAPSGFKALCTANLPTPTIEDPSTVMDVLTWTGDGTGSRAFTGLQFSPDFVWAKNRSLSAYSHLLYDAVRGAGSTKDLSSDLTESEGSATVAASTYGYLSSFDSQGFSTSAGSGGPNNYFNENTRAYVAWAWDAGSSTATNNSGSISSQVRANISAGFSIVGFAGTGTTGTVGHGLGVAPAFIIGKNRDSGSFAWRVYHSSLGGTKTLYLNLTNAAATDNDPWNDTNPTSATISLLGGGALNRSGNNTILYCFAPVASYSSFGSYVGNGSATNSPFVFCNFRPKFVLVKNASQGNTSWVLHDSARGTYNTIGPQLLANSSNAEYSAENTLIDFFSNGFSPRRTVIDYNYSGDTYVYAAFAEHPFQTARAR